MPAWHNREALVGTSNAVPLGTAGANVVGERPVASG
jgi:hypothetical protein